MPHYLENKTPAQRIAITRKRKATLVRNKLIKNEANERIKTRVDEITELEKRIDHLKSVEKLMFVSAIISGKTLLDHRSISLSAVPWSGHSGVYFLTKNNLIVYVGQAVNVYARVSTHASEKIKDFDSWAYLPCKIEALNKMESLYIHYLKPKLNGTMMNGAKFAPLSIENLIGIKSAD